MSKFTEFVQRKWSELTFGGKVLYVFMAIGLAVAALMILAGIPTILRNSEGVLGLIGLLLAAAFMFALFAFPGFVFNYVYYKYFWSRELVQCSQSGCDVVTTKKVWDEHGCCPNCSSVLLPIRVGKRRSMLG